MNGPALERGPATILIADDLPDLLQALKETLEREGFVVTAVDNGQSALEAIRANPPDIAVLDLKMPRM
ncbi:MAG: response regulator, partial [Elusimicrobiota bacterium]